MRSELLIQTIHDLWDTKRPIFVTGEPGVGKTTGVETAASRRGVYYNHIHAATCLTEDFGMPMLTKEDDKFGYKMPHWWPTDPDAEQIMCFDDMSQCGADIQKVIANIIQQRELHGHKLPKGVHVIATGNRQQDRAGANRILGHLANRYTELEWEVDLDGWCKYAIDHGANPSVISFLRFRPNLLQDYDPARSANPTCRAWIEGVSSILDVVHPDAEYDCVKGAIGEGAAAEFIGFRRIEKALPDIDYLLMHPDTVDVPTDPATLYAITGAIAHRVTNASFGKALTFAERMPQEFAALLVSYACRRDKALASTQAFKTWALANQSVLW
jgi:hypothetical protein